MDVKSSPVYFHVEGIKENNFNEGGRLKVTFRKLILNVGGGFDWKNQFFRAPYTGTYSFSISGSKDSSSFTTRANVAVRLNFGEIIGEALSSSSTQNGGLAFQFIRKLKANDTIELAMHFGTAYLLYFTGFLLDENLTI